ncbi:MAG TPA: exopolyphosphatase, partial [Burkholderiaceae bacterium]
ERMQVAQGALRQGVLYDLLDRELPDTDLRAVTVRALMQRFAVDTAQAERVARVANQLFVQVAPANSERAARKLDWAARLHEIGCRISHDGYPRHGAYILDNTDAAGFAQPELHLLGQLVQGQRGKVRKLDADLTDVQFTTQLLCLRLALALCHARHNPDMEGMTLTRYGDTFNFVARSGWAATFPQSTHLLEEEADAWQKTPWTLTLDLQ